MLKIRAEQMKVFQSAARQRFEERMLSHLERFAPKHSRILNESDIRKVIQLGEQKAKFYALSSERSVRLYIEMMLLIDSGFDTDPQIPWAAVMLRDRVPGDERESMDRLYNKAWDYADHVAADYVDGLGNIEPGRFIERIYKIMRGCQQVLEMSNVAQHQEFIAARLRSLFPNKCQYIGEHPLRRFVEHSWKKAQSYDVTTEHGIAFFIVSGFILGAGFDRDPQLPWALATLNDRTLTDQYSKVDTLLSGMIEFLKRWWA